MNLNTLTDQTRAWLGENNRKRLPPERQDLLIEAGAKFCGGCATVKPLEGFTRSAHTRDGLAYSCKDCARTRRARSEPSAEVKEARKQRDKLKTVVRRQRGLSEIRAYYASAQTEQEYSDLANRWMDSNSAVLFPQYHREVLAELGLRRCSSCRMVQPIAAFGTRSSGKVESQCKRCRAQRTKERYNSDLERSRQRARVSTAAYRKKHPWAYRLEKGFSRASKLGVPRVRVTEGELLEYWVDTGIDPNVSAYSGVPLTDENRSLDHFDPLTRPGTMGHVVQNLFPCTIEENSHTKRSLNPLAGLRKIKEAA